MLLDTCYGGDDNLLLKNVQAAHARETARTITERCRTALLTAARLIDHTPPFVQCLAAIEWQNIHGIQDVHDVIAVRFRHLYDDGGQLELPGCRSASIGGVPVDISQEGHYLRLWRHWLDDELEELVRCPDFVRPVGLSLASQNTGEANKANREACRYLVARYGMADWPGCPFADAFREVVPPAVTTGWWVPKAVDSRFQQPFAVRVSAIQEMTREMHQMILMNKLEALVGRADKWECDLAKELCPDLWLVDKRHWHGAIMASDMMCTALDRIAWEQEVDGPVQFITDPDEIEDLESQTLCQVLETL